MQFLTEHLFDLVSQLLTLITIYLAISTLNYQRKADNREPLSISDLYHISNDKKLNVEVRNGADFEIRRLSQYLRLRNRLEHVRLSSNVIHKLYEDQTNIEEQYRLGKLERKAIYKFLGPRSRTAVIAYIFIALLIFLTCSYFPYDDGLQINTEYLRKYIFYDLIILSFIAKSLLETFSVECAFSYQYATGALAMMDENFLPKSRVQNFIYTYGRKHQELAM